MTLLLRLTSRPTIWIGLSLLGFLLICYGNSFNAAWQYDDYFNIVNNSDVHMQQVSWDALRLAVTAGPDFQKVSRPLAYLSFALNYRFGGIQVTGYHVVNLVIHWLTAIVLFLFIRGTLVLPVFEDRYRTGAGVIAWVATVLWAVHPIQVTAVTYIVQRMASMAGFFYILSFYLFLKGKQAATRNGRISAYCGCCLAGACALITKENTVMLVYALLLYDLLFFKPVNRKAITRSALLAMGLTVLVFALGFLYTNPLKLFVPYENRPYTMVERLMTQPRVLFFYLSLLIAPGTSRMTILHDVAVSHSLLEPWTTTPAIAGMVLTVFFFCWLIPRHRLFAFCGLFFFLNHLVESSMVNLELIYEHRNYIPSMFLFVPAGVLAVRGIQIFSGRTSFRNLVKATTIIVIILTMFTTYGYNRIFQTESALWAHTITLYPGLSLAHNNLGRLLWDAGDKESAKKQFAQALTLNHFNDGHQKGLVFFNLGLYESYARNDQEKALAYYEKARLLYAGHWKIWFELAKAKMMMGKYPAAMADLNKALSYWPREPDLLNLAGIACLKSNQFEQAIKFAENELSLDKSHFRGLMVIAQAERHMGNFKAAMERLQRLYKLRPEEPLVILSLIDLCHRVGQERTAGNYLDQLRKIYPKIDLGELFSSYTRNSPVLAFSPRAALLKEIQRMD